MATLCNARNLIAIFLFNLLFVCHVSAYPALPRQENKFTPILNSMHEMMEMKDDSQEKMMHDLFALMQKIEVSYKLTFDMNGMFRKLWAEIYASNPYLERKIFYEYANRYLDYNKNNKMLYQYYYEEETQQYYHVIQQADRKELPVRMRWGINIGLGGLFIMAIPIPGAQGTGAAICMAGTMMCVDSLATIQQEREDEAERQKAGR